jgi:hypothetical protein
MPGAPTVRTTPVALASGPVALKPSSPAPVKTWNSGKSGSALSQIVVYSGNVLMAYGSKQYPQMLQACTALGGTAKKARALPPIPDAAMEMLYTTSLDNFLSGAALCESAISQHPEGVEDTVTHVNQAQLTEAMSQFKVGTTDLYAATKVLQKQ